MKMSKSNHINFLKAATIALCSLSIMGCNEEDEEITTESSTGITMSFVASGDAAAEFIINQDTIMSGEISAENSGIEQAGWRFYYPVGKTLFTSGYSDDNQCAGYADDGTGNIILKGEFIFDNALEMFGDGKDDETFLAMEIPRAGFLNRKLHFVDVNTVFVKKINGTKIFESVEDSIISWPTALTVSGDKLFIPFHKLHANGSFATLSPDSAFVAVYSYPNVGAAPEKIISDPRTSNIGANGFTTGMIEADNGDLYTYSCGATDAGFSPASTKPSGILKIDAGSTEFNENYFFNIEEATGGSKIFWFDYVGDNKAIARLITDNGSAWSAYGSVSHKLVMIDLENQTVTDIDNVPTSKLQYTSPIFVEDGKAYLTIVTATDAHVYQVDVETGTATKGAEIKGQAIKGFYRL